MSHRRIRFLCMLSALALLASAAAACDNGESGVGAEEEGLQVGAHDGLEVERHPEVVQVGETVTVRIINQSDTAVGTHYHYDLERKSDAAWFPISEILPDGHAFNDGQASLGPGDAWTDEILTQHLEPGLYRYRKELDASPAQDGVDALRVWAEFRVDADAT